jgi:hypothetical protein
LVYVDVSTGDSWYLGSEMTLVAHVSPHSRQSSGVVCAAGEMVIRLRDRTEIARRDPDFCDDNVPWIIFRAAPATPA